MAHCLSALNILVSHQIFLHSSLNLFLFITTFLNYKHQNRRQHIKSVYSTDKTQINAAWPVLIIFCTYTVCISKDHFISFGSNFIVGVHSHLSHYSIKVMVFIQTKVTVLHFLLLFYIILPC